MAGAEPSICYYSKESKQAVSTERQSPHKLHIKATCERSHCSVRLLQLYWYKMADHEHLNPAWLGNACLTLLAGSALFYECLIHLVNEESYHKDNREMNPENAGCFARRTAHTYGCFYWGLS